jgi:Flp pilus assembly protein TadB
MLDPEMNDILLWGMVALAITAIALAVLLPMFSGENVKDRIHTATTARSKKVAARSAAEVTASRKKAVNETLREIDFRKKKLEKASLRTRLMQAGLKMDARGFWALWSPWESFSLSRRP